MSVLPINTNTVSLIKKCDTHYKCVHCLRIFSQEKVYLTHLLLNSRQFKRANFKYHLALKINKKYTLITKKPQRKYKCSKCKMLFYTKNYLNKHSASHFEFKCGDCNATFNNQYSLNLHRDVHLRQYKSLTEIYNISRTKSCKVKKASFKNIGDNYRQLKCYSCFKVFLDKFSLIKHCLLNHTPILNNYACPLNFCQKTFKYKANWLTHLKIHAASQKLNCNTCNLQFRTFEILKNHINTYCFNKMQLVCSNCHQDLSQDDYSENALSPYIYPFIQKENYECTDCITNKVVNKLKA